MKFLLNILLFVAVCSVLFAIAVYGSNKQANYECRKWLNESEIYEGYYFTDWQVEQCESLGFEIKGR
jgi:hypothetical protein